jgi:multidrug resistance efflux pump
MISKDEKSKKVQQAELKLAQAKAQLANTAIP